MVTSRFVSSLAFEEPRVMSVRLRNLFFVSSLILGSAILSAQVPKGREVHADLSRVAGPHSQVPMRVVGAGRAEEGLRADWQEQLAIVQREIGFHYLRMHGLLNDEMGVYTEDRQGHPQINFQYGDSLYDALLKMHIRPFVKQIGRAHV